MKNTSEQVHLVKLQDAGLEFPKIWNFHRCFSKMLLKLYIHEQFYIFKEQVSVAASVRMKKFKETIGQK